MRRARLYLRLARLAPVLVWRMRGPWDGVLKVFSEAEAIHAALGHDYNDHLIRPEHRPLIQP